LAEQLRFVEQAKKDIRRLKNRLEHTEDRRLHRVVESDIKRLEKRCQGELVLMEASLRQHDDLANRLDLVISVSGIGQPTAITLIVRMPELGHISREQATLAGVAPFDHYSGRRKGQRHISGGRAQVRTALYAAAAPASFFWNPALKELYQRLTNRGHCHQSALIACARKLLSYANIVLRRATPWVNAANATA